MGAQFEKCKRCAMLECWAMSGSGIVLTTEYDRALFNPHQMLLHTGAEAVPELCALSDYERSRPR